MFCSKSCDVDLERLLITEIRQLISTNKTNNSPIVNGEDGGDIEAGADFHVCKIRIGDNFALTDD